MAMMKNLYEEIMNDPELADAYAQTLSMSMSDAIATMDYLIEVAYVRLNSKDK